MKTLLFVDDEFVYLRMMQEFFEARGYEVLVAQTGEEALARVREVDLGAVFLDLRMPGMDGVETFRCIRELDPELPVLIVSGHTNEDEARYLLQEGAFDSVAKPVELMRLREIVRQLGVLQEARASDDTATGDPP